MQVKKQTHATQITLRTLIDREFSGSQVAFSRRCGLDPADTSRVLNGIRPATVEIVGRAAAALGDAAASALIAAFISDVLAVLPKSNLVVLRKRPIPAEWQNERLTTVPSAVSALQ